MAVSQTRRSCKYCYYSRGWRRERVGNYTRSLKHQRANDLSGRPDYHCCRDNSHNHTTAAYYCYHPSAHPADDDCSCNPYPAYNTADDANDRPTSTVVDYTNHCATAAILNPEPEPEPESNSGPEYSHPGPGYHLGPSVAHRDRIDASSFHIAFGRKKHGHSLAYSRTGK
ncbi:hypothetical protein BN14_04741 [Rhizoctonia solani AG-1 IB]|uniref:Uncharacterized protein n=1 Tax=Thanatephorus cucumeris (strain AG1-IB / isolate 7/3/14) TaxID=1108050 RepID=M5BU12_THACB|nr:hypothetical protein BN14_04741 [Rhizoctonia solani AG-1 IB]